MPSNRSWRSTVAGMTAVPCSSYAWSERLPDSHPAKDRCHLAEDGGVGAVDGVVLLVVREQPHLAVLALERLDGGLVVEHCGHDLAVLSVGLLSNHDVVAVAA